jgi:hypothetical protein
MRRALATLSVLAAGGGGLIATALPAQAKGKSSSKSCGSVTIIAPPRGTKVKIKVSVTHGTVACATARSVIKEYEGGGIPVKQGKNEVIKTSGGYACVIPKSSSRPVVCTKGSVSVTGKR